MEPTHIIKEIHSRDAWNSMSKYLVGKECVITERPGRDGPMREPEWETLNLLIFNVDLEKFGRDTDKLGNLYAILYKVKVESISNMQWPDEKEFDYTP